MSKKQSGLPEDLGRLLANKPMVRLAHSVKQEARRHHLDIQAEAARPDTTPKADGCLSYGCLMKWLAALGLGAGSVTMVTIAAIVIILLVMILLLICVICGFMGTLFQILSETLPPPP